MILLSKFRPVLFITELSQWTMHLWRQAANLTRKEKALGIFKYCEDICPVECKHVSYSVTPFYKLINSRSIAAVNIYYDEFAFTEIKELPKITFDNLLANIGGVFGLFVGASWMSMVEIIEFVLNILYKFGEKLTCQKKVTIKWIDNKISIIWSTIL